MLNAIKLSILKNEYHLSVFDELKSVCLSTYPFFLREKKEEKKQFRTEG